MTEYNPKADLAPGVFDIREAIADRQYPKGIATVYFDDALAVEIERTARNMETLAQLGKNDEYDQLSVEFDDLVKKLQAVAYKIKLRGVSQRFREDIVSKSLAKFPFDKDFLGRDNGKNEFDRDIYHRNLLWGGMIYEIEDPEGNLQATIDESVIEWLRENLPEASQNLVNKKIAELSSNADAFNYAARDADFLSKP